MWGYDVSEIKLDDTLRVTFPTLVFATGAAVDADGTPTCVVLEQGSALAYAPTVTNKATGLYEVAIVCTTANGFEVAKEYTAYVVTVIGAVTARVPVASFIIRTNSADTIITTLMAYSHDTGLTILGAFRRMDAVLSGKATGLKGVLARFFMRDDATAAVSAVQDTNAGTRDAASVTGSEA